MSIRPNRPDRGNDSSVWVIHRSHPRAPKLHEGTTLAWVCWREFWVARQPRDGGPRQGEKLSLTDRSGWVDTCFESQNRATCEDMHAFVLAIRTQICTATKLCQIRRVPASAVAVRLPKYVAADWSDCELDTKGRNTELGTEVAAISRHARRIVLETDLMDSSAKCCFRGVLRQQGAGINGHPLGF